MKLSKRNMPASLSFAAGTLFGAIVMLIPFASAGHARSAVHRVPASAERPADASAVARGKDERTPSAVRESREKKAPEKDNQATCDVQLD
jgi:hypothetical protein